MVNRISKSIHANIKSLKDSKSTTAVIKNSSTIKKKALDKNLTPSKSEKIIPNENKSFKKPPMKKEINLESDDKSSNLNKTLPSKGVKKIKEFNKGGKEEKDNASKLKEDVASDSKGMKVYKLNSTMKDKSNIKLNDKDAKVKESKELKDKNESKDEKKNTDSKSVKNPKFVPKTPMSKKTKPEETEVDKSDTKSTKNNLKQIPKSGVKINEVVNNKKKFPIKQDNKSTKSKENENKVENKEHKESTVNNELAETGNNKNESNQDQNNNEKNQQTENVVAEISLNNNDLKNDGKYNN